MLNSTSAVSLTCRHPIRQLTSGQRQKRLALRNAWLAEVDPTCLFHRLFDVIPGMYFFAKSRRHGLMFFSQSLLNAHRIPEDAAVIGLTDFDTNPPDMAEAYAIDDELIYASGQPLLNRVKLGFDFQGVPDWFVVNKMPIRSRAGKVIGVMGFRQSYEGRSKLLEPSHGLSRAVGYIRQNYQSNLSIAALARRVGLSQRQLERKFRAAFGVNPQQFLIKTRLLAACRALRETDLSLCDIASVCGFPDQSAFTRQFRIQVHTTPRQFRLLEQADRQAITFQVPVGELARPASRMRKSKARKRRREGEAGEHAARGRRRL